MLLKRLGLLLLIALTVTACAGTNLPASVSGGECRVFEAPPYAVRGAARYDQRWIDSNVEAGVSACRWQRPQPRPAGLDAGVSAVKRQAAAKPSLGKRVKATVRKVLHRVPAAEPAVAPVVEDAPAPAVAPRPPRSDLDELLDPSRRR